MGVPQEDMGSPKGVQGRMDQKRGLRSKGRQEGGVCQGLSPQFHAHLAWSHPAFW